MRSRRGFTLIELLIVVVIIGILAAIAIPKFAATKGKANFAAMKSDLHNLTTAEEAFFYDHAQYTTRSRLAAVHAVARRSASSIIEATATGWSATVARIPSRIRTSARSSSERRPPLRRRPPPASSPASRMRHALAARAHRRFANSTNAATE